MYLEIDEGLPEHPKAMRLCARMKDQNAWAWCIRLWRWASRSAPDGSLAGMEPSEVEIACGYASLDGRLYAALVAAGFVDELDGKPAAIHNWKKRQGGAIERMEAGAERQRAWRAHQAGRDCGRADCRRCEGSDVTGDVTTGKGDATITSQNALRDAQGKSSQGKSKQAKEEGVSPARGRAIPMGAARPPNRPHVVGAKTVAFLACWDPYPNKDKKDHAAQVWQELAEAQPGGETALRDEILTAYAGGRLQRYPFDLSRRAWPLFENFLADRRWRDEVGASEPKARASPGMPSTQTRDAAAEFLRRHGEST